MARRADHSPDELKALLIEAGHGLMAERGFAGFSGREAARRAGYTVGTIYHVFGSLDVFILAINTRTFALWTAWLEAELARCGERDDRIAALVRAYFKFAEANERIWMAIYDHRRRPGLALDPDGIRRRRALTAIVDREVARALGVKVSAKTMRLTRSLLAIVHGHCVLHIGGSFALMNEPDPLGQAVARVHEVLGVARGKE